VNNFPRVSLDFVVKIGYIITMRATKTMKKESIFTVTFTDGGEVFIQAMDEGHARRIIESNGLWSRNVDSESFTRTIKKVEKN